MRQTWDHLKNLSNSVLVAGVLRCRCTDEEEAEDTCTIVCGSNNRFRSLTSSEPPLKNGVNRGAMCVFLGVACALAAVGALILLDVAKVGRSSSGKSGHEKEGQARGPADAGKSTTRHKAAGATGAKHGGHITQEPRKTRATPATVRSRRTTLEETDAADAADDASTAAEQTKPSPETTDSGATPGDQRGGDTADERPDQKTDSASEAQSGTHMSQTTSGTHGEDVKGITAVSSEGMCA
ncbi:uncharacterized protein LOC144136472 isoform X1 [Amblyomma americanum]